MNTQPEAVRMATAWDWLMRLREDSVTQDEVGEWLSWYELDESNKRAFDEARALWQQTDRMLEGPNPLMPELGLERSATPFRRSRFTRRRKLIAAAAVMAAVAFGLTMWVLPGQQEARPAQNFARETYLPDGSRVALAAKSSVTMQFSDKERLLTMQDGVAFFKVAPNRERPFIVKVGQLNVRAVGTAFNIRSTGGRVVVTVSEGTVDVYPTAAEKSGAIRISEGREIIWAAKAPGPTIAAVDPAHALAWRQGRLDFLNEPLSSAIADINRYSKKPIIIRDEAVGRIVFSGTVLATEADDWVKALPSLFPIDVLTDSAGNVVLAHRS